MISTEIIATSVSPLGGGRGRERHSIETSVYYTTPLHGLDTNPAPLGRRTEVDPNILYREPYQSSNLHFYSRSPPSCLSGKVPRPYSATTIATRKYPVGLLLRPPSSIDLPPSAPDYRGSIHGAHSPALAPLAYHKPQYSPSSPQVATRSRLATAFPTVCGVLLGSPTLPQVRVRYAYLMSYSMSRTTEMTCRGRRREGCYDRRPGRRIRPKNSSAQKKSTSRDLQPVRPSSNSTSVRIWQLTCPSAPSQIGNSRSRWGQAPRGQLCSCFWLTAHTITIVNTINHTLLISGR
ncbi:hypothetical protein BC629DRAFT_84925 [Irpex lacteus]|nr:hypothetical protein BC629DRAFT_84925 [Irpex lacteus]